MDIILCIVFAAVGFFFGFQCNWRYMDYPQMVHESREEVKRMIKHKVLRETVGDIYGASGERGEIALGLCVVCMDNPANGFNVSCCHLCVCRNCAESIETRKNECPCCRKKVAAFRFIYGPESERAASSA